MDRVRVQVNERKNVKNTSLRPNTQASGPGRERVRLNNKQGGLGLGQMSSQNMIPSQAQAQAQTQQPSQVQNQTHVQKFEMINQMSNFHHPATTYQDQLQNQHMFAPNQQQTTTILDKIQKNIDQRQSQQQQLMMLQAPNSDVSQNGEIILSASQISQNLTKKSLIAGKLNEQLKLQQSPPAIFNGPPQSQMTAYNSNHLVGTNENNLVANCPHPSNLNTHFDLTSSSRAHSYQMAPNGNQIRANAVQSQQGYRQRQRPAHNSNLDANFNAFQNTTETSQKSPQQHFRNGGYIQQPKTNNTATYSTMWQESSASKAYKEFKGRQQNLNQFLSQGTGTNTGGMNTTYSDGKVRLMSPDMISNSVFQQYQEDYRIVNDTDQAQFHTSVTPTLKVNQAKNVYPNNQFQNLRQIRGQTPITGEEIKNVSSKQPRKIGSRNVLTNQTSSNAMQHHSFVSQNDNSSYDIKPMSRSQIESKTPNSRLFSKTGNFQFSNTVKGQPKQIEANFGQQAQNRRIFNKSQGAKRRTTQYEKSQNQFKTQNQSSPQVTATQPQSFMNNAIGISDASRKTSFVVEGQGKKGSKSVLSRESHKQIENPSNEQYFQQNSPQASLDPHITIRRRNTEALLGSNSVTPAASKNQASNLNQTKRDKDWIEKNFTQIQRGVDLATLLSLELSQEGISYEDSAQNDYADQTPSHLKKPKTSHSNQRQKSNKAIISPPQQTTSLGSASGKFKSLKSENLIVQNNNISTTLADSLLTDNHQSLQKASNVQNRKSLFPCERDSVPFQKRITYQKLKEYLVDVDFAKKSARHHRRRSYQNPAAHTHTQTTSGTVIPIHQTFDSYLSQQIDPLEQRAIEETYMSEKTKRQVATPLRHLQRAYQKQMRGWQKSQSMVNGVGVKSLENRHVESDNDNIESQNRKGEQQKREQIKVRQTGQENDECNGPPNLENSNLSMQEDMKLFGSRHQQMSPQNEHIDVSRMLQMFADKQDEELTLLPDYVDSKRLTPEQIEHFKKVMGPSDPEVLLRKRKEWQNGLLKAQKLLNKEVISRWKDKVSVLQETQGTNDGATQQEMSRSEGGKQGNSPGKSNMKREIIMPNLDEKIEKFVVALFDYWKEPKKEWIPMDVFKQKMLTFGFASDMQMITTVTQIVENSRPSEHPKPVAKGQKFRSSVNSSNSQQVDANHNQNSKDVSPQDSTILSTSKQSSTLSNGTTFKSPRQRHQKSKDNDSSTMPKDLVYIETFKGIYGQGTQAKYVKQMLIFLKKSAAEYFEQKQSNMRRACNQKKSKIDVQNQQSPNGKSGGVNQRSPPPNRHSPMRALSIFKPDPNDRESPLKIFQSEEFELSRKSRCQNQSITLRDREIDLIRAYNYGRVSPRSKNQNHFQKQNTGKEKGYQHLLSREGLYSSTGTMAKQKQSLVESTKIGSNKDPNQTDRMYSLSLGQCLQFIQNAWICQMDQDGKMETSEAKFFKFFKDNKIINERKQLDELIKQCLFGSQGAVDLQSVPFILFQKLFWKPLLLIGMENALNLVENDQLQRGAPLIQNGSDAQITGKSIDHMNDNEAFQSEILKSLYGEDRSGPTLAVVNFQKNFMRHVFSSEDYLALLKFRKETRKSIVEERQMKPERFEQIIEEQNGSSADGRKTKEKSLSQIVNKWRLDRLVSQTEQIKADGGHIGENQMKLFGINRSDVVRQMSVFAEVEREKRGLSRENMRRLLERELTMELTRQKYQRIKRRARNRAKGLQPNHSDGSTTTDEEEEESKPNHRHQGRSSAFN